jgi:hypothetical protein
MLMMMMMMMMMMMIQHDPHVKSRLSQAVDREDSRAVESTCLLSVSALSARTA